MTKQRFFKYLTRVHKWTGLIIGVQLLLWMASGLFMTLFHIEEIRGEWLAEQIELPVNDQAILTPAEVLPLYSGQVTQLTLENYVGHQVYNLSGDEGQKFIDASNGMTWSGVPETDISQAAKIYYFGEGELTKLTLLQNGTDEYSYYEPIWQARFEGADKARLYLHPQTGELLSVRTNLWRVYDFMWGLHIMDWTQRDRTHSWWLRLAAIAGSLFVLTGFGLLAHRFLLRPKRGA